MMKLYTSKRAPNPRRVDLFIAAHHTSTAALGIEMVNIDLATAQNKHPEYLAVNPLGLVPALQLDDQEVIYDSIAICRYIEEVLLPNSPIKLFGNTPKQRAMIEQMSRIAEFEILIPMMFSFQLSHPFWADKKKQIPEAAPIIIERAAERFTYFDNQLNVLNGKSYLVDNTLSVADLTLYVALDFGRLAGLKVNDDHLHLFAFYQRMHEQFGKV